MMGNLASMRDYMPAPRDAWRKIDAAEAEREITPDPHMNPFVGMPQEINRIAGAGNVPDAVIDELRWHGLSDAAIGLAAGSTVARAIPHPLARSALIAGPIMGALVDPAGAANPDLVRRSTSVFRHDKPGPPDLWHRIAKTKMDRPLSAIEIEARGAIPQASRQVDPASLEGKFLMPLPGDPTSRGISIEAIDKVPLSKAFETQGGRGYLNELGGFANAPGAATTAANRVKQYQDKYDTDVIGTYMKMGPQSADFSSHTWGLLSRMLPNAEISKAGAKDLNARIRERVADAAPEGVKWQKFPGIDAPNLEPFLIRQPDNYRKAFINAVEQQRGKIAGVPDVVAARYATTDPALLNVPTSSSGLSMTKLTGETWPGKHPDYKQHVGGEGSFGLGMMLPREVMFPDMVQMMDKMRAYKNRPDRWINALHQKPPTHRVDYGQLATPQWVDRTSRYMGDVPQMGEGAALDKYLLENFGWK